MTFKKVIGDKKGHVKLPKTLRGIENKIATGDGRKSWKKQANEAEEAFFDKKKKQGRKKK